MTYERETIFAERVVADWHTNARAEPEVVVFRFYMRNPELLTEEEKDRNQIWNFAVSANQAEELIKHLTRAFETRLKAAR